MGFTRMFLVLVKCVRSLCTNTYRLLVEFSSWLGKLGFHLIQVLGLRNILKSYQLIPCPFFLRSTISSLEMKLATATEEVKATNEALEARVADPKLKDQERQITELSAKVKTLEENNSNLRNLLDEAAIDLKSEQEENEHLTQTVTTLQVCNSIRSCQSVKIFLALLTPGVLFLM